MPNPHSLFDRITGIMPVSALSGVRENVRRGE
jgi:hypothetical protein